MQQEQLKVIVCPHFSTASKFVYKIPLLCPCTYQDICAYNYRISFVDVPFSQLCPEQQAYIELLVGYYHDEA